MRKIRVLRPLDKRPRIRFGDIPAEEFDATTVGMSRGAHGSNSRPPAGRHTHRRGRGISAPLLHAAVGLAPLVTLTRLPGIAQALDLGYRWFGKNRLLLAERCMDRACTVDSERSKA
jgi:hypothetical protein